MPRNNPEMSYTLLRNFTEQFRWVDEKGTERKGFNPPRDAAKVERIPFFVKFITEDGRVLSGEAICIAVVPRRLQRKLKFVNSGEIRIAYDFLIVEVNGIRFTTH